MELDAGSSQVPCDRGHRRGREDDRSFVSHMLRLTLLALDFQEVILEGRQAKGMQLEKLTQAMPGAWKEQRERLAIGYFEEG